MGQATLFCEGQLLHDFIECHFIKIKLW
jgi:hypothetical protein